MTTITQDGTAAPAPSIKARQQAMWASGDFAVIGTTLQIVGELLCEAVDIRSTERVLDVAAGNGNATLAAARHFANVTSTDYVPALLERGQERARAEGLQVTFETADAEALPYADASFDVVLSTFGVMFAPDHHKSAAEMMRVCRKGGRIGLTSWTPAGFLGQLFRVQRHRTVRGADVRVHVGDLPLRERVQLARRALRRRHRALVDHLGLDVFPQVVAGDDQVQRRFGVRRVDAQRFVEHLLRLRQPPLLVIDDAQHVVDVGVRRLLAQHLGETCGCLGVLAGFVMRATARD